MKCPRSLVEPGEGWKSWSLSDLTWTDQNLKEPRLRRALPMFLKLQKWSKGWEDGWTKMPQTYCTFDHGGCHASGKTTWICETLDAVRSSTVPKKLCECLCQRNVSSTQEWRGACYAGSCQFHARYRKRQTDCYPATAHLLHFDNLI